VDVREGARADRDYLAGVADLEAWEARHGRIPDGAIVLFRTGWSANWAEPARYLGTARRGPEAVAELHFPGIAPEAARWLLENRRIAAVGIDTASIDRGQSKDFLTHRILLGADVPAFENVDRLEELPESGAFVVALPMKIRGGSGGPARIVALIPNP
jgi:kynurenine formamidase